MQFDTHATLETSFSKQQVASRGYPIKNTGPMQLDLEFDSDGSITEFRVAKIGVEFVHKGALVHRL